MGQRVSEGRTRIARQGKSFPCQRPLQGDSRERQAGRNFPSALICLALRPVPRGISYLLSRHRRSRVRNAAQAPFSLLMRLTLGVTSMGRTIRPNLDGKMASLALWNPSP